MIKITDIASDKLKDVMEKNKGKYLRVVFEGFGWGGPSLGLTLDVSKNNEHMFNVNGVDLMIDKSILPYTTDSQIDYIDNIYETGFVVSGSGC